MLLDSVLSKVKETSVVFSYRIHKQIGQEPCYPMAPFLRNSGDATCRNHGILQPFICNPPDLCPEVKLLLSQVLRV